MVIVLVQSGGRVIKVMVVVWVMEVMEGVWVVEVHVIVSGRAVVLGMMNETERNKGRGRGCKNAGGGTRQYPVLLFWYCFSCLHFTL